MPRVAPFSPHPSAVDLDRRGVVFGWALAVAMGGVAPGSQAASSPPLAVETPWCLPGRPSANAAGYLVIDNRTGQSDRLTGITSPAARSVSIHESRVAGGVATMAALGAVPIPAHTVVRFEPGGMHLMLSTLLRPLSVGQRVPVTLWFKVAGRVRAELIVVLRPPHSAAPKMRM